MDYQCQTDFGCRRRKHHCHHCDEQIWSEPERTWTGDINQHKRPQPFGEFAKHKHHHHRQPFGRPEQFEGHHHHFHQHFSPFQQFVKPEENKFSCRHFHQQFQFPFKFENRCNQQFWPFSRPEKFERHNKHLRKQQFSPFNLPVFKLPDFILPDMVFCLFVGF